jgi:hypothetical protein
MFIDWRRAFANDIIFYNSVENELGACKIWVQTSIQVLFVITTVWVIFFPVELKMACDIEHSIFDTFHQILFILQKINFVSYQFIKKPFSSLSPNNAVDEIVVRNLCIYESVKIVRLQYHQLGFFNFTFYSLSVRWIWIVLVSLLLFFWIILTVLLLRLYLLIILLIILTIIVLVNC